MLLVFFFRFYLFIFRQRGREGEREGEKHQCALASCVHHNPGMCPDWELNLGIEPATLWAFGLLARAQSTELYQPGPASGGFTPHSHYSFLPAWSLLLSSL